MFGVVLVSLVLPFVSVSCRSGATEAEVLRFHGYDLLTGGEPQLNPDVGPALGEEGVELTDLGPQPFAIAVAVLAALGVAVGLLDGSRARVAVLAIAVLGIAALIALRVRVAAQVREQASAGERFAASISTEVETGYWAALGGFGLAAASGMLRIVASAPPRERLSTPGAPSPY